ncbi:hypothetical protein [Sporosarcina cascadiensis]|uniref:hypothetical protein n=1 Tax=Sporosarcina cascadiensis TaxID=2660747 RepID=UPI00129A8A86|nr:hypothetical protein [Sporosarcina cascadiensis]
MPVTQYYPIGSITVPSSWIAVIAGFVMTYLFIRIYFGKAAGERIGNILFNLVIIWKLSVILTDFSTVIHYPLSILYFHGGTVGWILAILITGLLTLRQNKREKWQYEEQWSLLLAFVSWQAVYQIVMVFLNEGSLLIKSMTIILFALLWVFVFWIYKKRTNTVSDISIIWIALHLMVSALQPGVFISLPLITSISGGVLLVLVQQFAGKSLHREEELR